MMVSLIKKAQKLAKYLVAITYPFTEQMEDGTKVFLSDAYYLRKEKDQEEHPERDNFLKVSPRIFVWESFTHIWLSVLFWVIALIIHAYAGSPWGAILPLVVLVYFAAYELVIDRVRDNETWTRSIIDWIIWVIPMLLFFGINYF